jgi:hypothetical protein
VCGYWNWGKARRLYTNCQLGAVLIGFPRINLTIIKLTHGFPLGNAVRRLYATTHKNIVIVLTSVVGVWDAPDPDTDRRWRIS